MGSRGIVARFRFLSELLTFEGFFSVQFIPLPQLGRAGRGVLDVNLDLVGLHLGRRFYTDDFGYFSLLLPPKPFERFS